MLHVQNYILELVFHKLFLSVINYFMDKSLFISINQFSGLIIMDLNVTTNVENETVENIFMNVCLNVNLVTKFH